MGPKMSFRYCLMSAELRGVIISLDAVPVLLFVLLDLAAARAHRSSCATSFFHVSQGCVCKAADSVSLMWGWRASFPGAGLCTCLCSIARSFHAGHSSMCHSFPLQVADKDVEQDRSQDLNYFISNQPPDRAQPINHLAQLSKQIFIRFCTHSECKVLVWIKIYCKRLCQKPG